MLSNEIAGLIDETHLLHEEVIVDMENVSLIGDTINEINGFWEQKSVDIDQFLSDRGQEFSQFLSEFGNKNFYAAPLVLGTGDGRSPENSATLNSILTNLEPLILNTVYLQPGEHVLPATISVIGYRLKLLPLSVNPNDPVIICTTHTTSQFISRDTGGAEPNQSQLCDAHAYNECPLLLNNCQVVLSNLEIRGTKNCLSAINSSIQLDGAVKVELWVHSMSCTQHSGCALTLENSSIYGEGTELIFQVFHPDYITCADNVIESANPLTIRNNSNFFVSTVSLINNIAANSLPKSDSKLGGLNCSYQTSFWIESNSRFSAEILSLFNVKQVFFGMDATIRAHTILLQTSSEPVCWLSIVQNTLLKLGGGDWTESLNLFNPSSVATIVGINSELRLENTNFIGMGGLSSTFAKLADNSRLLSSSMVLDAELPQDSGFVQVVENISSTAIFANHNFNLANNETPVFLQRMLGKTLLSNGVISGNGGSLFLNEVGGCFIDNEQIFCGGVGGGGLEWFDENQELMVPSEFTLSEALLFLRDKRWPPDISVVIKLSGVVELIETVYIDHPCHIVIEGEPPEEKSFVGFGGNSGSVGAWNVNFQISDASSVVVGRPIVLKSSGNELDGCWNVLSKNANSITVEITSQNTTIPTISLADTMVFPSMLTVASGKNCLIVDNNSKLTIKNMLLFSSANSPWSGKLSIQSFGVLYLENVGFNGWYTAVEIVNSELNSSNIYVGNTVAALNIANNSSAKLDGYTTCNGNTYGINVFGGSDVIYTTVGFVQGNDVGIKAIRFSNVYDENLSCKSNATLDYVAETNSFIRVMDIEAGSQTSPMPNTSGNNESIILTS